MRNLSYLFFLLFQLCNVHIYVSGNRKFHYSLYILMKYDMRFPDNLNRIFNSLVEYHKSPVERFLTHTSFLLQSLNYLIFSGISASTCKLISLNVRGIGNFKKRKMSVENRNQFYFRTRISLQKRLRNVLEK